MRLTKVQKYAIAHLHTTGRSAQAISTELNIPTSSVEKHIKSLPVISAPVVAAEEVVKPKTANDFMLRETATGNKNRGVAIMTQQASMLGDSVPKSVQQATKNIFRPKG